MILENRGKFENVREYGIRQYKAFGMTVKKQLYASDKEERYFHIYYSDARATAEHEKTEAVQREIDLGGYFVIVTSRKMTAKDALELYKSRDTSEKLFLGDKSYLGNGALRVQSDETANAKIFAEFVALIIRCKMYTLLKDEMERLDKKPNYMTVPAAIRELDKIEMIKGLDGRYRMDHAVTATQKTILSAFQMDDKTIRKQANELADMLEKYDKEKR